ncbi:hypothetical protein WG922_14355 [Ramlibacter sp. AN1015]|uniref:hypothetical protein n=1 Tax=Ramlibacter sp. AN1015 TaxID=3133428 RepID=UPI0030C4955B
MRESGRSLDADDARGTWDAEQAFQSYALLRLKPWPDICQEFLPMKLDPPQLLWPGWNATR